MAAAIAGAAVSGPKLALTLPKVPFPNLTLTLALIYVDRLKEKNPAAKGEPGCSHRLFLVAYIIAAKYRCSVELATLLQEQQYRSDASTSAIAEEKVDLDHKEGENAQGAASPSNIDKDVIGQEQEEKSIDQRICEARSRAEVILSNQAWVQLLSLGSFMRPMPTASSPANNSTAAAASTARTSPSQPLVRSTTGSTAVSHGVEAKPLPIQSVPVDAQQQPQQQVVSPPASNSTLPSTPLPPSSILQVKDLDRMETEFLTFLDYDLAAKSQDLDTCWGLLVGNKEI
ncbi:hypothetical protein BGX29_005167 [Mortierella sp. GBA35]|nr:hypothetical protein BGX29_005167 [Mortierella sp. GBA35]